MLTRLFEANGDNSTFVDVDEKAREVSIHKAVFNVSGIGGGGGISTSVLLIVLIAQPSRITGVLGGFLFTNSAGVIDLKSLFGVSTDESGEIRMGEAGGSWRELDSDEMALHGLAN